MTRLGFNFGCRQVFALDLGPNKSAGLRRRRTRPAMRPRSTKLSARACHAFCAMGREAQLICWAPEVSCVHRLVNSSNVEFSSHSHQGANNVDVYLGCSPDCKYALFPDPPDCSKFTSSCGDGQVQSEVGETCDDGINDGLLGHCTTNCRIGPGGFCGDGAVNPE